jgi:hypothetical protein
MCVAMIGLLAAVVTVCSVQISSAIALQRLSCLLGCAACNLYLSMRSAASQTTSAMACGLRHLMASNGGRLSRRSQGAVWVSMAWPCFSCMNMQRTGWNGPFLLLWTCSARAGMTLICCPCRHCGLPFGQCICPHVMTYFVLRLHCSNRCTTWRANSSRQPDWQWRALWLCLPHRCP